MSRDRPPSSEPNLGPRVAIGQHSTAGRKPHNDDSYGVVVPDDASLASKGIAMAIADGMSSSEAAKEASENCVKSFLQDYYATHSSWSVKRSVGVVLKSINSWLYAQGQSGHGGDHGMVSTFSGLVLKAGVAHIFHAGDSRIGLVRQGRLEPLTRDFRELVDHSHPDNLLLHHFSLGSKASRTAFALQVMAGVAQLVLLIVPPPLVAQLSVLERVPKVTLLPEISSPK